MKKLAAAAFVMALAGCRGQPSEKPPVHFQPVPQMDWQPKYLPEGESKFFADKRAMRPLVAGTLAVEDVVEETAFTTGKENGAGGFVNVAPVKIDESMIKRGQERFNIYCSPCHDATGSGHGMVVQHGFPLPIDLHSERVRTMADGQIFDTITHGVRNMPAYAVQVPVEDRWAIVTWVRTLQRSQHASVDDVPEQMRNQIEPEGGAK